jgi:hypothetical protein
MQKPKKHLSKDEEFQIMKLVMDKFLWLGVILVVFGFWKMIDLTVNFWFGFFILLAGVLLMMLFTMILVKEYNFMQ